MFILYISILPGPLELRDGLISDNLGLSDSGSDTLPAKTHNSRTCWKIVWAQCLIHTFYCIFLYSFIAFFLFELHNVEELPLYVYYAILCGFDLILNRNYFQLKTCEI